ncbi:MAG: beta-N-acetylhexosaminidase [Verrucomicrobia bacterium]|nr:beta-N-acetylhexosaminidase [Verrucomicrobiota bacterium]
MNDLLPAWRIWPLLSALVVGLPASAATPQGVPFTDVTRSDAFWAPLIETHRLATIPHLLRELERQGSLGGLRILAGEAGGRFLPLEGRSKLVAGDDADDLRLIPFPKEVRRSAGAFALDCPLVLEAPATQAVLAGQLLNDELQRAGLPTVQVQASASPDLVFRLRANPPPDPLPGPRASQPPGEHPEGYTLEVDDNAVVGAAATPAGLHYSLQTLRQLIRANRRGSSLPALTIRDWPSLRWRCFQDDLTRGPSSKLETLQFEASLASFLKLNLMTYYMEYQFAFQKHPRIGPPDGSLTPEDLQALVAYARPQHVEILGNQQSFGHFAHILKHPEYAALRETADVLTPVREETYRLLEDLYAEVCPLLPFPWFNVCCDETWGLGTGPSRDLAAEIGVGGVYVRHLRRVHDLLRTRHNKRMMMWGDIILQHPDHLDQIPKGHHHAYLGLRCPPQLRGPDRSVRPLRLRVLRLPRRQQLEPHPARLRRGRDQHPALRPRRRETRRPRHDQHRLGRRRRSPQRRQVARRCLGRRVCLERVHHPHRRLQPPRRRRALRRSR